MSQYIGYERRFKCVRVVLPELSLMANTKIGRRGRFGLKTRHLTPLTCKEWLLALHNHCGGGGGGGGGGETVGQMIPTLSGFFLSCFCFTFLALVRAECNSSSVI